MAFVYRRVIRFAETDAAGVVYFASLLNLCHEAYEAAIASTSTTPSIDPKHFFSSAAETAVPIVHTSADFYQPLFCGDTVSIALLPKQITPSSFEITYVITRVEGLNASDLTPDVVVQALTRHVCIATQPRRRTELPPELTSWIAAIAELE